MSFSKVLLSLVFAAAAGGAIANSVGSGPYSITRCTFVMTPTPEITDVAAATEDVGDAMAQSLTKQFPGSIAIPEDISVVFNGNGSDTVSTNFTVSGQTDDAVTTFVKSWQGEVLNGEKAQWAVNFNTGCEDLPPASINSTLLLTPTPEVNNASTALDDISMALSRSLSTEYPDFLWQIIDFLRTLNDNGTDTVSAQFIVYGATNDSLATFTTGLQGETLDGDEAQWIVNSVTVTSS